MQYLRNCLHWQNWKCAKKEEAKAKFAVRNRRGVTRGWARHTCSSTPEEAIASMIIIDKPDDRL